MNNTGCSLLQLAAQLLKLTSIAFNDRQTCRFNSGTCLSSGVWTAVLLNSCCVSGSLKFGSAQQRRAVNKMSGQRRRTVTAGKPGTTNNKTNLNKNLWEDIKTSLKDCLTVIIIVNLYLNRSDLQPHVFSQHATLPWPRAPPAPFLSTAGEVGQTERNAHRGRRKLPKHFLTDITSKIWL